MEVKSLGSIFRSDVSGGLYVVENQRVYNPWAENASPKTVEKQAAGRWLDELSVETAEANYKRLSQGLSDKFKDVKDMAEQFPLTTSSLGIVGGVCLFVWRGSSGRGKSAGDSHKK